MNYYVSADGPLLGDGSLRNEPSQNVCALQPLRPGDDGHCRSRAYTGECVNPKNGGTSDRNRLYTVPRYRGSGHHHRRRGDKGMDHVRDDIWMTRIRTVFQRLQSIYYPD